MGFLQYNLPFGKLQASSHVDFSAQWLPSGYYQTGGVQDAASSISTPDLKSYSLQS